MRHIDNSILKDSLQLNVLWTWINIRVNSSIKTWKDIMKGKIEEVAWKFISYTKIRACTLNSIEPKYITLHLFLYATFSLKQNLVFKFYLVLIGILDNFRPNLFTCLPFDYQLLFHWSWSLSSASIHFLIRTSIRTTKILRVQSCKLYNNKYIIASTETTNTEDFTFIAFLVFKLLSRKVLFINRKDNSNY